MDFRMMSLYSVLEPDCLRLPSLHEAALGEFVLSDILIYTGAMVIHSKQCCYHCWE